MSPWRYTVSRTDKTDPGWLKAVNYAPIHHDHRNGECVEETFEDAQFWATRRPRYSWPKAPTCTRYFGWRYSHVSRHIYGVHAPGDFIRDVWTAPERQRERLGMRDAMRLYNADGEDALDGYDFENRQHRHGATWYWD